MPKATASETLSAKPVTRIFPSVNIPKSTRYTWLSRGSPNVITDAVVSMETTELQQEVLQLQKRVLLMTAFLRLVFAVTRILGVHLDAKRIPEGKAKAKILSAVEKATAVLPLKKVLNMIHLSSARYHRWKRADACNLDDQSSCPHTSPTQVTPKEKAAIKDMVTSKDYRHMPIKTLALYAQRIGNVFVSASTWYKLVRQHGWKRPRRRLYPEKPKVGIRATRPGCLLACRCHDHKAARWYKNLSSRGHR